MPLYSLSSALPIIHGYTGLSEEYTQDSYSSQDQTDDNLVIMYPKSYSHHNLSHSEDNQIIHLSAHLSYFSKSHFPYGRSCAF